MFKSVTTRSVSPPGYETLHSWRRFEFLSMAATIRPLPSCSQFTDSTLLQPYFVSIVIAPSAAFTVKTS